MTYQIYIHHSSKWKYFNLSHYPLNHSGQFRDKVHSHSYSIEFHIIENIYIA